MARVRVISPDGKSGTIEESELEAAQARGFRLETAQDVHKRDIEKKYGDQDLRAGLEGVARTATFGLSDAFAKGFGVDPQDVAGRREANPISSTVGEFAGVLAPGGAGKLIGRAGSAVAGAVRGAEEVGALRTITSKAAGGAVEGGLWGLGSAITEDALDKDKQLAGEKLLAIGGGGIVGAGIGALEAGFGMAGKKALDKAFGTSLRDRLNEFSEEAIVRQIAQKSDFNKMNLFDRRRDVGRYMLDKGWGMEAIKGGAQGLQVAAEVDSEAIGAKMSNILREADSRSLGVDTGKIWYRVEKEVLDDIKKDPLMAPSRKAVENYIDEIASKPYNFEELWQMQSNIRKKIGPTEPGAFKEALWKTRKIIRDELIDQTGEISPHYAEQLRKLNKDYGLSQQVEELAGKRALDQQGNRYISLTDYMAGAAAGAASGGPMGIVASGVAALGNKLARERGGFALAEVGDRLAKSKVVQQIADGFKRHFDNIMEKAPVLLGPYRVILEQAAARGAMDLLATHVQLAKHDPDYLGHIGLAEESPDEAAQYVQKAERLNGVGDVLRGFDGKTDQAIGKFLGTASGRPTTSKRLTPNLKDFNQRVAALNTNMEQGGHMSPSLDQIAPATNTMLQLASMKASQFLLQKAPKSPTAGMMPALQRPWQPSATELNKWYRYVEAVENPHMVLNELNHGTVNPEHIEALTNVYPKLFQHFKEQMLEKLAELPDAISYQKRLALSVFMGPEMLGMTSEQMQLFQSLHAQGQGDTNAGGSGPKPDGRQNVNQENNLETQAQRMEKR